MVGSPIEEIKNRLDIIEVVGSYVKLQKCGQNYRANCPFHSEKKPSFFVSSSRQIFKCFGCGASGDIFKFVMLIENVEFGDALKLLAQKAGIELRPVDPKLRTERQRIYEICELSAKFFEVQLHKSKKGQEAKKYLVERGINEESLKKWRIGYAPDFWRKLSDFLVSKGYDREEIVGAGLAVQRESDIQQPTSNIQSYDRFRGRIMFPIFDINSQVIGFGGRIFGAGQQDSSVDVAKYINTPNTLLYNKSQVLYGLNYGKMQIRKEGKCILTEGYTDAILAHQSGFENTIATSGTALTPYQLKILKRYTLNLLTAFDMDIAGNIATKRGIDLAQKEGFNIKVIMMPKDSDPADVISQNPADFEKLVKKAKPIMDFYFESVFSKFGEKKEYTPEEKKEISQMLLPVIKRIPNKIEQSSWIQKLSRKIEVPEEIIFQELQKAKAEEPEDGFSKKDFNFVFPKTKRKELLEGKIVSLVCQLKENKSFSSELIDVKTISFFSEESRSILQVLMKEGEASQEIKEKVSVFYLQAEVFPDDNPSDELRICFEELKQVCIRDELKEISQKIKRAQEEGDSSTVEKLLQKFNNLSKKII